MLTRLAGKFTDHRGIDWAEIVGQHKELVGPVLKINNRATGGWRTEDILGGPKSLETKKLGSLKG